MDIRLIRVGRVGCSTLEGTSRSRAAIDGVTQRAILIRCSFALAAPSQTVQEYLVSIHGSRHREDVFVTNFTKTKADYKTASADSESAQDEEQRAAKVGCMADEAANRKDC
jgi:hypothetical protein